MKLSVIVIGYNSWHYLESCFASLSFIQENADNEIIYVDNGSTDNTVKEIKNHFPSVIIIENHKNLGISKARNHGIAQAKGEYLWLLDSDTETSREVCNTMLAFMDSHPEVGLCGCRLVGNNGKPQASCRRFPTISEKWNAMWRIILKRPKLDIQYDLEQTAPFRVDYVIGACQMFRRMVLEKVGSLDEHFFFAEDADFCRRITMAGYQIFYLPQVSMYHFYQRVSTQKPFSKVSRKHLTDLIYYFWKWK
jgi:GT2 family glycosyltransferase